MTYEGLQALMLRALASGATRKSMTEVEWNVAAQCASTVPVTIYRRPGDDSAARHTVAFDAGGKHPLWLTMQTPCRRCSRCLTRRWAAWAQYARQETVCAARTWFGTLTLSANEQYRMQCDAVAALRTRSVDFNELTPSGVFRAKHARIGKEITKYLKRVRAVSGAKLRYLIVLEAHRSGEPHYHALVHEVSPDGPVRHAVLDDQWGLGFTRWKLVDPFGDASGYVCKYLTKSAAARVRSSQHYGRSLEAQQTALALAPRSAHSSF